MSEELLANYVGAFDGHLTCGGKMALVIVDVVKAYLDPACSLYAHGEAALASNVRLRTAANIANVPVVFTRVEYQADGLDGGHFYRKVPALKTFLTGSPLTAFPDDLQPGSQDVVVTKQYASAFFGTSLAATLHAINVDTVLITGYSTSGCVRATALDALQNGFIPFVIKDACADRHPGPHEASLFDIQAKYAEVIDEAGALELIS
tara:strand:+ start:1012 stop:1629 length:618 start_codon:yes stop_codon:yes gene_type:complete